LVAPLGNRAALRRLLDRFGFGARPGELDAAVAAGFTATAGTLLQPPAADPGVLATPRPDLGPVPTPPNKQDTAAKAAYEKQLSAQADTLTGWWLDRMVAVQAPLPERLTWFWHGHFATSEQKVRGPMLMQRQNDTLRTLGAGSFTALAKAMIVDPAMLIWLDGQQNEAAAPNENLARESMELFMLGIGHYTETDVREAARALTGWVVDRRTSTSHLVPRRHDNGSKTVLGVTADLDADSYVDAVLGNADSAAYVVGRLWFRLVSATPPPADVLARLIAGYGPGRDITGVLHAIAAEPAFTDSANVLVKQPVEWLVGLLRALNVAPARLPAKQAGLLLLGLRAMGQVPFLPPNVGGWPADDAWLTTSADLARLRLAQVVVDNADLSAVTATSVANRPAAVGALLGVDAWTERTNAALAKVSNEVRQLGAVAACAPEYIVSM
jgi:uncharacterized protein (DUF1800 family)